MNKEIITKYLPLITMTTIASQMLTVAVGYQIYELTRSAFLLGIAGLIQFLPRIILIFHAGTLSDKYDRRIIVKITQASILIISLVLGFLSFFHVVSPLTLLIVVFLYGAIFTIEGPAVTALLPNLVSREEFAHTNARVNSINEAAYLVGPALAGLLYLLGPDIVYWAIIIANVIAIVSANLITDKHIISASKRMDSSTSSIKATLDGFKYIWQQKGILGAISLDLFVVLFGGVTALLPIYATTILEVGPAGFGFLRSANSIGAVLMAIYLAYHLPQKNVGKLMFGAVAVFGLSIIVFAFSRNFFLSMFILIILGAADQISVLIRSTFIQVKTPDEVRGRVTNVNLIFISASSQLGEFESGMVASLMGAINATIFGGVMVFVVILIWYKYFAELRELQSL